MAKSGGLHTPRPTSVRAAARATLGSSSSSSSNAAPTNAFPSTGAATKLPFSASTPRDFSSHAKVVAKCLDYDDNFTVSGDSLAAQDDDLAPLLELPDPDVVAGDASSSSVISASPDDAAVTASADSALAEVAARGGDSTGDSEEPLPSQIADVLAELQGARGLSPRSKCLVAAFAEAAASELCPAATALRLRRAAFWGKVRVGILAVTVTTVATIDIALAVALIARRSSRNYYDLPPT